MSVGKIEQADSRLPRESDPAVMRDPSAWRPTFDLDSATWAERAALLNERDRLTAEVKRLKAELKSLKGT